MKKLNLLLVLALSSLSLFAQKKVTTSGSISFDATTELDKLPVAHNKTAIGAIDTKTGTVQFEANVKNFAFTNPMMQEHFNGDNWLDSDKFPKIAFKGTIADLSKVDFTKDGKYDVTVNGDLTIRHITKPVTIPGNIVVKGDVVSTATAFSINLADYEIKGVPIEAGKVAKSPKIMVAADLK